METAIRKLALKTGVTLEIAEVGASEGAPVILLHGFTDSRRSFEPLLPYLADMHAVMPTQRGHGGSDKPAAGYDICDLVDDIEALMDAMAFERAVIVGHSMGAAVACELGAAHPQRVRALVLMGAFADFSNNPGALELRDACAELTDPVPDAFARDFQESTLAAPIPKASLDAFVSESLRVPAHVWRQCSQGFIASDLAGAVARAALPIDVIWGDQDAFCPRADQDVFVARGAKLHVLRGVGHAVHWEAPEACANVINRVVARTMAQAEHHAVRKRSSVILPFFTV